MTQNNFITGKQATRLGQGFTLIWLIIILVLCLMPANDLPKVSRFPHLDKIVHFSLYFILTISAFATLLLLRKPTKPILILLGAFTFSFMIEILQAILPFNRSFSILDLVANSTGLVSGYLFHLLVTQKLIAIKAK